MKDSSIRRLTSSCWLTSAIEGAGDTTGVQRGRTQRHGRRRRRPTSAFGEDGPELTKRIGQARGDDEHSCRYALVRAVLDWYRTGVGDPIIIDTAVRLLGPARMTIPTPERPLMP
jgi:hypothetical protein